jgi:hypothetical protein
VTLDANGEATVQVPLNDSLTAFRIVAIASAARIVRHRQDRDAQFAGPDADYPACRRWCARATVSAPASRCAIPPMPPSRTLTVANAGGKALAPQPVSLAAGEAREDRLGLPGAGIGRTLACNGDGRVPDRMARPVRQRVRRRHPRLKVSKRWCRPCRCARLQATLLQLDGKKTMPVSSARRTPCRDAAASRRSSARAWAATCRACATT